MKDPNSTINNQIHLSNIKIFYTKLVDYLKELLFQKGILERPSYMELSRKLGFTYNWIKDKKDTLKTHSPMKKTFDDLFLRLSKRYENLLKKSWNTIESKFQNLYNIAFPTEPHLPSSSLITNKSIKRKFFDDLKEIIRNYFPKARIFDTDISRIFFRRAKALKDSHLKTNYKFRRLDISTLFSMIYKIRLLTKEDFASKIRDIEEINQETLSKIKLNLEMYIESFIFSNPYNEKKYICDEHYIGPEFFKPEFKLTFKIWFEISKVKRVPQLLKHTRKLLGYYSFGRLTRGYLYSWDGIMYMLCMLRTFVPINVYSKVFEKCWQYIDKRCLYPVLPMQYHSSWYTESTVKFHVVILLIRDLGLDILNLEPIKSEAFKKTDTMESYTYERHHIYINNKLSIDVNRLVLVMHKNHSVLEGKTDLVSKLIQSRIDLTFNSPQYYKENVKNWEQKWQKYLERRTYLIENGIENFIRHYFTDENGNNYVLNRFFKNIPNGKIQQNIKSIFQVWIDKNRPAPILNTYILKRHFFGTPKLLTSQLITTQT